MEEKKEPPVQVFEIRREVCVCPVCGQRHPKRKNRVKERVSLSPPQEGDGE